MPVEIYDIQGYILGTGVLVNFAVAHIIHVDYRDAILTSKVELVPVRISVLGTGRGNVTKWVPNIVPAECHYTRNNIVALENRDQAYAMVRYAAPGCPPPLWSLKYDSILVGRVTAQHIATDASLGHSMEEESRDAIIRHANRPYRRQYFVFHLATPHLIKRNDNLILPLSCLHGVKVLRLVEERSTECLLECLVTPTPELVLVRIDIDYIDLMSFRWTAQTVARIWDILQASHRLAVTGTGRLCAWVVDEEEEECPEPGSDHDEKVHLHIAAFRTTYIAAVLWECQSLYLDKARVYWFYEFELHHLENDRRWGFGDFFASNASRRVVHRRGSSNDGVSKDIKTEHAVVTTVGHQIARLKNLSFCFALASAYPLRCTAVPDKSRLGMDGRGAQVVVRTSRAITDSEEGHGKRRMFEVVHHPAYGTREVTEKRDKICTNVTIKNAVIALVSFSVRSVDDLVVHLTHPSAVHRVTDNGAPMVQVPPHASRQDSGRGRGMEGHGHGGIDVLHELGMYMTRGEHAACVSGESPDRGAEGTTKMATTECAITVCANVRKKVVVLHEFCERPYTLSRFWGG
ncbi:hypothetical protein B0H11DRAFT_1917524 [Mycena galericulata]|nr:hypothetical protein B0H11DRAFT_1917524 [Mycena galericulata]